MVKIKFYLIFSYNESLKLNPNLLDAWVGKGNAFSNLK